MRWPLVYKGEGYLCILNKHRKKVRDCVLSRMEKRMLIFKIISMTVIFSNDY